MHQLDELKRRKAEIYRIARRHNAAKVYVFGSCARREEKTGSDIDLLAEFGPDASLFDHAGLEHDLAECFGRKVDVVAISALKPNAFADSVKKDMVPL